MHDAAGAHDHIRQLCSDITLCKACTVVFEEVTDPKEKLLDKESDRLKEFYDSTRNTGEE